MHGFAGCNTITVERIDISSGSVPEKSRRLGSAEHSLRPEVQKVEDFGRDRGGVLGECGFLGGAATPFFTS